MSLNNKYYIAYKPFGMACQFSEEGNLSTLANLDFVFPKDVYPVGRLDADSEGLLILSNDKRINNLLLDPKLKHPRTYYAQVEGIPSSEKLSELEKGVEININGKTHKTLPCKANIIDAPELPERNPPIRHRANIPTTWITITISEGKNRQVRRMTAKIGYPTLRLVRYSIENISLDKILIPGKVLEMRREDIYRNLKLRG